MKLIIIHGPPAVGKLTVAREIEKLTGFKVFHNHLSIDCVKPLFEFGSKPFTLLVEIIRLATVTEATLENVDLIFTVCYGKGVDDEGMERMIEAVESNGGEVCLVLLVCDQAELEKRVVDKGRHEFKKIGSVEAIRTFLSIYELFSPVPGRETLVIDTTDIPPDEAATRIIEHYKLETL